MYILIRSLLSIFLEMLNYRKNSHSSLAILMARILSIATNIFVTSNKKRTVTVYTMVTILLLSVVYTQPKSINPFGICC